MKDVDKLIESVRSFLERDDIEVRYSEEEDYGFKKSEAPSHVVRIKEAKTPDGLVLRVSITESYYDDAAVSNQETMVELYQNWMEPRRLIAYLYFADDGTPVYSDRKLFSFINEIWSIL